MPKRKKKQRQPVHGTTLVDVPEPPRLDPSDPVGSYMEESRSQIIEAPRSMCHKRRTEVVEWIQSLFSSSD